MNSKICRNCHIESSLDNFYKREKSADGYYHVCRVCHRKKVAENQTAEYHARYNSLNQQLRKIFKKAERKTKIEFNLERDNVLAFLGICIKIAREESLSE